MKRFLTCILSVLVSIPFIAQDNPVVMTVNGYDVKKSEFEYFFSKNSNGVTVNKRTVKQYANLYLNFKLKVQAAMDAGMDQADSFIREYRMYRDMQAEDYLVDKEFIEGIMRQEYDRSVEELGPDGLAEIRLIMISVDDDSKISEKLSLLEEIAELIEAGASFKELAMQYSEDSSQGDLVWTSRSQLPDEVADIVFSLPPRQLSKPSYVDGVAFLVRVENKRQLGSFEDNYDDIYEWAMRSGIVTDAKCRKANAYAERLGWNLRDDAAVAHLDSVLEEVEPDFGNISREYHDGLLLFDISNREIWEKVSSNPGEMELFFEKNRKRYNFNPPCFKGMVLFCQDEDVYGQVKSLLEGVDMSEWVDRIVGFNRDGIKVRVMKGSPDTGIFLQGQNAYVDKIVFGKGEYEPMQGYPYVNVVGRVLKQPDSMQDVAGKVVEDYQNHLENEWVRKLRKQYKYKIYNKSLKKVSLD